MTKILIREVELDEVPFLQQFASKLFKETYIPFSAEADIDTYITDNYTEQKLKQGISNPESSFYFIEVDETIAGFCKLDIGDLQTDHRFENALEVEKLYIDQRFKGQGLGRKLIYFAEEHALELNKSLVWLGVWEGNKDAAGFYEHLGFEPQGTHEFQLGSELQTDFLLAKRIKAKR
ncbi:GNAT family N-acetyltransferase [Fructilactobacillus vespulae]|uniref:GNAT family N-acetyltransferase n=1 Tax=Fructilactobacillus vespulae TaxID=1249630 RepID=UPI0039B5E10C